MFGRDSIFTSLQALPFAPELAATTLRELAARQGSRIDDFRDEDPGPDPARDALRRADRVRGAAALALLRQRRRHRAVRRAARRVRALDRRPPAGARAGAGGPGGAELDRGVRRPDGQRLRLVPAPQRADRAREPVLEGFLGLDLLPRRASSRASPERPASSRGMPTTPACAAPGWRATVWKDEAYAVKLERQAADLKRRFNRDFWVADGGLLRDRARHRRAGRWTRSARTSGICSGAASSIARRRHQWPPT